MKLLPKKIIYFSFFLLIGFELSGQYLLGGSLTVNMSGIYGADIYSGYGRALMKVNISREIYRGVEGKNLTNSIEWDLYPVNHLSQGVYTTYYGIGFNYIFKWNLFTGISITSGHEVYYRNCFDELQELTRNGIYHIKKKSNDFVIDFGIEAGYIINRSEHTWWILGIGYEYFKGVKLFTGIIIPIQTGIS